MTPQNLLWLHDIKNYKYSLSLQNKNKINAPYALILFLMSLLISPKIHSFNLKKYNLFLQSLDITLYKKLHYDVTLKNQKIL